MKDTTTAPALPDAVYEQAVSTFSFYADADAGGRAVLRDLLYDAIRDAIAAADAAGYERGRAAALAELRLLADDVATGGDLDDFFDNVMILVDGAV